MNENHSATAQEPTEMLDHERVLSIIKECLSHLDVPYTSVFFEEKGAHPLFQIRTDDSKTLIGAEGAVLDALNHVVRRIIERILGEKAAHTISIDVNGYRSRKIEELANKARMVAERVRLFKSDVELSPMTSYERMIIHALFAEDPDITTESAGEGKFRRVIMKARSRSLT